ncbi:MAG TPA: DUF2400 family protein, partial [Balneolaceae bacterium]|nr:DUF2400 family protein [Balneolaceae bacterium]
MSNLKEISTQQLQNLKPFLDEVTERNECAEFIAHDPISFTYAFYRKEDRILAGFFAALMAWGRRDVILRKT